VRKSLSLPVSLVSITPMRRYWKSRHPRIGDEARAGCTIQIHVLNARESNLMFAAAKLIIPLVTPPSTKFCAVMARSYDEQQTRQLAAE
jgi:hypothetical protein